MVSKSKGTEYLQGHVVREVQCPILIPDTIAVADWQNEKSFENCYGHVPWCCFMAKNNTNP